MNKISKCKCCGNYEIRLKLFENKKSNNKFPELDLYFCRAADWKWCKLKNNWCRSVASHCDFIVAKPEVKETKLKQEDLL